MHSTLILIALLAILIINTQALPSLKCLTYLLELKTLYQTNKGLFLKQMAPFMVFSGKQADDLGFPKMCSDNGLEYTTVKLDSYVTDQHVTEHPEFLFSFYYGFCFTDVCSVSDLNEGGKFVIEKLFEDMPVKIQAISFYDAELEEEFSASSIIILVVFGVWMLLGMVGLFSKWFNQCQGKDEELHEIEIALQQTDKKQKEQKVQSYDQPIRSGFFKHISIGRKYNDLFTKQQSTKISQFSNFKIFSVPLIIYGYYFYLCNNGAYNIFAFNSEIYTSFYSNIATFAYYIPDLFFFISGYLLTKNVFNEVEFAANKTMLLVKRFGDKLIRLYPIYVACLVIFWGVVPSLHAGPVWKVYAQQEMDRCDTVWWRNLLMIDNFFSSGCFNFSWWVQVEVQYTLLALLTFMLLFINKSVGTIVLYVELLASWILLFILSQKLPVELQVTIKNETQHYFKSFHSHLPFYLTGVMLALIIKKESSKRIIKNYYFKNTLVLLFNILAALTIFFLVLFRPSTFAYDSLNIELALCRMGILYCFIVYCLPGLIKERTTRTIKHKLAAVTYPIILISGVVVGASFWALQAFPYVSGQNLFDYLLPNLFISIPVGITLNLLFNFNTGKKHQARVL